MSQGDDAHRGSANRVVELFAGVGGFHLALREAGWDVIWANQWEPSTKTQHAADCYRAHFGSDILVNEDINTVLDQVSRSTICSSAGSRARTTRSRRR